MGNSVEHPASGEVITEAGVHSDEGVDGVVVVPEPELLEESVSGAGEGWGRAASGGEEEEREGVGVGPELGAEHAEEEAEGSVRARRGEEADRDIVGEGGGRWVGGEEEEDIVGSGGGGRRGEGEELGEEMVVWKWSV